MRILVFIAMLLLTARIALAVNCATYPDSEGLACVMSDGTTQGACNDLVCIRTYTIPGNPARTGTGTISSSGNAVTGSGTAFTTELHVGDVLTAGDQRRAISAIASNTSLTSDPAFSPVVSASAFTYTNPIVRWVDENGNTVAILDSRGLVAFGRAWARGAIEVLGAAETAVGATGKPIGVTGDQGGPAGGTTPGGFGTTIKIHAGDGGPSAVTGINVGQGGTLQLTGGDSGIASAGGVVQPPGSASLVGGYGNGIKGADALVGGGAGTSYGDVQLAPTGGSVFVAPGGTGVTQFGANKATIDNGTGDITKIKNVPVAGMWNVNAFQQANAGGM